MPNAKCMFCPWYFSDNCFFEPQILISQNGSWSLAVDGAQECLSPIWEKRSKTKKDFILAYGTKGVASYGLKDAFKISAVVAKLVAYDTRMDLRWFDLMPVTNIYTGKDKKGEDW